MAGHSKWSNIKHIKGAKDAEKSINTQRISRQLRLVIKDSGGADPKLNPKLAHVLEQARSLNVPLSSISHILKTDTSKDDTKPGILEARGPGGSYFVIDILTNNITRTKSNLAYILKKNKGSWADGASRHIFNYKGIIRVGKLTANQTLEDATEHGIELGVEDVEDVEEDFLFITDPKDFYNIKSAIDKLGYQTKESNLHYVPVIEANLSEDEMESASKLYHKLEEDPDVVKIHDNIV